MQNIFNNEDRAAIESRFTSFSRRLRASGEK